MMRPWQIAAFAAVLAALTAAAAGMLFSTQMVYDDEGYVLYSFKMFAEHGHLYGAGVFSQYGPFPFAFALLLHALGMPFTHDAGRWVALAEWSLSSLLCASTVWRRTRSFAWSLFALASVFALLWVTCCEPNHPGNLIAPTIALLGFCLFTGWRTETALTIIAIGSAALVLTKVNVGGLTCVSALAAALLASGARHRGLRIAVAAALLVLVPWLLMKALIGEPWVQTFALLASLGGLGAVVAAAGNDMEPLPAKALVRAVVSGVATVAVVLLAVMARHSSASDLLSGIILEPLMHPIRYHVSFTWHGWPRLAAFVSLGACLLLWWYASGSPERKETAATLVAFLRLAAFAGMTVPLFEYPNVLPERTLFPYVPSALWLFLWPVGTGERRMTLARVYLGLLLWGQWMHPYPVPGSQISWGLFLCLPLGAIGVWEAVAPLARAFALPERSARGLRGAVAGLAMVPAIVSAVGLSSVGARYFDTLSFGLAGAEDFHLPDGTTGTYQILEMNARSYADQLFTFPGMYSFNLWTGVPTPTLANATQWFVLLSPAQQQAIIGQLEAHPDACIIRQDDILQILDKQHIDFDSPLTSYIRDHFDTRFAMDGFAFMARKQRVLRPLGFFDVARNPSQPVSLVSFQVDPRPGVSIGRLVLEPADRAQGERSEVTGSVRITPLGLDGAPSGPSRPGAFPLVLPGRSLVEVYVPHTVPVPDVRRTLLIGFDPEGTRRWVLKPSP